MLCRVCMAASTGLKHSGNAKKSPVSVRKEPAVQCTCSATGMARAGDKRSEHQPAIGVHLFLAFGHNMQGTKSTTFGIALPFPLKFRYNAGSCLYVKNMLELRLILDTTSELEIPGIK